MGVNLHNHGLEQSIFFSILAGNNLWFSLFYLHHTLCHGAILGWVLLSAVASFSNRLQLKLRFTKRLLIILQFLELLDGCYGVLWDGSMLFILTFELWVWRSLFNIHLQECLLSFHQPRGFTLNSSSCMFIGLSTLRSCRYVTSIYRTSRLNFSVNIGLVFNLQTYWGLGI